MKKREIVEKWARAAKEHARLILGCVFFAVVLACLCAGLWPFVPPGNGAQWTAGQDGLRFVRYGTALSHKALQFPAASPALSMEVLLQPRTPWTRGTPVAIYNRDRETSLEIQQVYADLRIVLVGEKRSDDPQARTLELPDVFLAPRFLLTITSDGKHTLVYVNGKLLQTSASPPLSTADLSGQVILGNAPVRNHQWTGEIKGLAVYAGQLTAQTVQSHSMQWAVDGAPRVQSDDKPVALYLFREQEGRTAYDTGSSRADLDIPRKYVTVDQIRFETPYSEARDANYKSDAIFNVYGFMPLGFTGALFFGCFLRKRTAALVVTAIGLAVSLTIEYGQSFLPTRYSGTTDLFTNTLGTALGVLACYCVIWLAKKIWVGHVQAQPR